MRRGEPGGRSWAQERAVRERRCGSAEPARPGACRRLPQPGKRPGAGANGGKSRSPASWRPRGATFGGSGGQGPRGKRPSPPRVQGPDKGCSPFARRPESGLQREPHRHAGSPGGSGRTAPRGAARLARARRTGRASPSADPGGDEGRPRGRGSAALVQPKRLTAAARPASPFS